MVRLRAQSCKHQAFNPRRPPECPADGPFKRGLPSKWWVKVISPMPSRGGGSRVPWYTEPPCFEVPKKDTEMVPHICAIWCPCGARMSLNGATNVSKIGGKGFLDKILWETMQYQIRTRLAVFYTHLASRAKRGFHDFCSKYQFLAHTKTWWEIFVIIHNKNRNSWKNCAHFGTHLGSKCTPAAW